MGAERQIGSEEQTELFAKSAQMPAGFEYFEDVISRVDEDALVTRLATLPFEQFEFHGYLGKRRVVSFGWRYDFNDEALRESDPIPDFLLPLREEAAALASVPAMEVQHVLVTEYAPGAGIGWHRDKAVFKDVIAFSMCSSCTLRLRRKQGSSWRRASIRIQPRSAYVLRGPSRREWEHSVPPVEQLRYSITFRNFGNE